MTKQYGRDLTCCTMCCANSPLFYGGGGLEEVLYQLKTIRHIPLQQVCNNHVQKVGFYLYTNAEDDMCDQGSPSSEILGSP